MIEYKPKHLDALTKAMRNTSATLLELARAISRIQEDVRAQEDALNQWANEQQEREKKKEEFKKSVG